MARIGICVFHIMVWVLVCDLGLGDLFINDNSGSGCGKDPMAVNIIYQTMAIDNLKGYIKCFLRSDVEYIRIHIDIYESDKRIYSTILEKTPLLLVALEYLTDEFSYMSLYYDEKDITCPQKYIHYNVYHLIKSGGVRSTKVTDWQPACFEFPTEVAEVVWPVDLNFQAYCICTKEDIEKGCDCPESMLFDIMIYDGKVCFTAKSNNTDPIAVFFQETKVGGCGSDCDLITLLTGYHIDVPLVDQFSFDYNQLYFGDMAYIAWLEAQCDPEITYELIQAEDNTLDSPLLLQHNTSTFVNKTVPASRYYVRALLNDMLCTTSIVSLQVPKNVNTKATVLYQTIASVCVRPSSASSALIMPQEGSDQSCICTNLIDIEHCSCIRNVEFDVFYNSSSNNPLCFANITKNDTRIHFMSQYFNSLSDRIQGFPLFNQELLDSFSFVIPSKPLPPNIINFINTNNSLCFVDIFNGFLNNITYLIDIVDITGYTRRITHEKTEPNCHQLHYNNQPSLNNDTKFDCGSLGVTVRSKNEIGISSLNTTNTLETGNNGEICDCFGQNVNISLQVYNSALTLLCSTYYVDFYNRTKFLLNIELNDEIAYTKSVDCSRNYTIPSFTSDATAIIYWMPIRGGECPVERRTIVATQENTSKSTYWIIIGSGVGGSVTLLFIIAAIIILIRTYTYKIKRKRRQAENKSAENSEGNGEEITSENKSAENNEGNCEEKTSL